MPNRKFCTKSLCHLLKSCEARLEVLPLSSIECDKGTIWCIDKIPKVIIISIWIESLSQGLEEDMELALVVSLDISGKLMCDMVDSSLEFEGGKCCHDRRLKSLMI